MQNEIIEEGVHAIVIDVTRFATREYRPLNGWTKWFRDELGQVWVKFSTVTNDESSDIIQHVIPASRVVDVQYRK